MVGGSSPEGNHPRARLNAQCGVHSRHTRRLEVRRYHTGSVSIPARGRGDQNRASFALDAHRVACKCSGESAGVNDGPMIARADLALVHPTPALRDRNRTEAILGAKLDDTHGLTRLQLALPVSERQ